MTTARLDWPTALTPGARVVPVILVAGVPVVLTPAGVRPTTVAVSSGTVDPLFWPGTGTLTETLPDASTFDPVKDLLDPNEVLEIAEEASVLKGDIRVEALVFSLLDTDGEATAMLSVREGRTTQLLGAAITETSTTIPLVSAAGFPASGIASIARETFLYSSVSMNDLTSSLITRGRYGSHARAHDAPAEHRPLVSAGGPRNWQSRLATVWLCALSDDGTTLTDPTLLYAGTVGAGVQLKGNLTRWSIPLDHVTESLSRKLDTAPIDLYGYAHYSLRPDAHPLLIGGAAFASSPADEHSLQWTADANDNDGWHPTVGSFVDAANRVFSAATTGAGSVVLAGNGKIIVRQQGSDASPRWFSVAAAWDNVRTVDQRVATDNTPAQWVPSQPAPEACFRLNGWVRIPSAVDFARIPSTFSWAYTSSSGDTATAALSLVASTGDFEDYSAFIVERDSARSAVRVSPAGPAPLCTERTAAKLGVVARGAGVVATLRAGALGIDALTGQDIYQSAVDWDHLEAAFAGAPSGGLPQAREYRFTAGADSFLALLIDELRLRGMCLAMRFGRITGVRMQSLADTESVVATITEADLLTAAGVEIPIDVIDATEPLASTVRFSVPTHTPDGPGEPREVSVSDSTFQGEFGDGEAVECRALLSLPPSLALDVGSTLGPLYAIAQQILGPLAEPSRSVRLPLTPLRMGLQPGDLVALTHTRIPSWVGTRGVTAIVCQVQEVRRQVCGGRVRATATLRLQSSASVGYAPEVLVAAGGLSSGSPIVTIDATTGWGPQCHAQDRNAAGEVSTLATAGFVVGDEVVLSAMDDRTPIADERFALVAVGTSTVTLDGNPSAGMAAAAAGQYGVSVRWAEYDDATTRQHTAHAWVADASTGTLGSGGDPGKRWAA